MFNDSYCLLFISLHHSRVPDYVGEHDGSKLAGLGHCFIIAFEVNEKAQTQLLKLRFTVSKGDLTLRFEIFEKVAILQATIHLYFANWLTADSDPGILLKTSPYNFMKLK